MFCPLANLHKLTRGSQRGPLSIFRFSCSSNCSGSPSPSNSAWVSFQSFGCISTFFTKASLFLLLIIVLVSWLLYRYWTVPLLHYQSTNSGELEECFISFQTRRGCYEELLVGCCDSTNTDWGLWKDCPEEIPQCNIPSFLRPLLNLIVQPELWFYLPSDYIYLSFWKHIHFILNLFYSASILSLSSFLFHTGWKRLS